MRDVINFFARLFDTSDWPPRWHCGKWTDFHGWLYIISDLLIWAAYFAIPVIIIRFITYKKHQRFLRLYFLFAAFILACGATHFLDAVTFWIPVYRLNALVRAITAIISWLTVFALVRTLPYAFSLKEPKELENEINMREKAETELKQKNKQLEESRITFKNVFDYSAIGIALVSPKGNWLTVNQAVCTMLDYSEEELMQLTFQDITHPDELAADLAFVNQLLNKERETYQMEKRYITSKGNIVYAVLSVSLVWADEEPAYFISQIVDITAKTLLAFEIEKKNMALETANKELQNHITRINEFNRIIGHNLRGPATSIINAADFLERSDDENDRRLLLSKMKGTSQLIVNTINDLKDFLEIQINQDKNYPPADFKDALQNSLHILEDHIRDTNAVINTRFEVDKVLFPKVYLESVFYNLVSNAIKYRNKQLAPVIDISTKKEGRLVVLQVSDNGIGINLERYANDIFKYQKIFHKGYESNGVGLFLTKTQVESYGGKIEVQSEVNKGTTFIIYFNYL